MTCQAKHVGSFERLTHTFFRDRSEQRHAVLKFQFVNEVLQFLAIVGLLRVIPTANFEMHIKAALTQYVDRADQIIVPLAGIQPPT